MTGHRGGRVIELVVVDTDRGLGDLRVVIEDDATVDEITKRNETREREGYGKASEAKKGV